MKSKGINQFFPFTDWLLNYKKQNLQGDISAGLTVGVMLIPQGMAYAMLAGLPPIYGLYASITPLIIYALFGTSRQLAVGPAAMVALLIAAGVGEIAPTGSNEFIAMAILLALMVGVFQFLLGIFRLGFLVNFLSHPVISGFTSAAALIIGFSQLKHLLGMDIPRNNFIHKIIINAFDNINELHLYTFLIGISGMIIILLVKRFSKIVPGPLVAVVFGILTVYFLGLDAEGVKIVGTVPEGLPSFTVPEISLSNIQALLPAALVISLIGFMESIAVAKAIHAKHRDYELDSNQELVGLGVANIVGSFFQAFPATGGFGRTAVNDQSGANTGLASIISASFIALTLLFLTPLFYFLPKAILASVIMIAVVGLIDFKEAKHLWKTDKVDFTMLAATFLATLVLGIEEGISLGVILSLVLVIYRSAYPHIAELGNLPGTNFYRNLKRFDSLEKTEGVLIVRFDAQLYFANLNFFKDKINKMIDDREDDIHLLVLDFAAVSQIDSSALHMLHQFHKEMHDRGISIKITSIRGPVRDKFESDELFDLYGRDNFYLQISEAIHHHLKQQRKLDKQYATQSGQGR